MKSRKKLAIIYKTQHPITKEKTKKMHFKKTCHKNLDLIKCNKSFKSQFRKIKS